MRVVSDPEELKEAFDEATSEAKNAFGDGAVYLEKYLEGPATWRYRSWPTPTATSSISSSGNAPSSAATRRSSKSPPRPP